MSHNKTGKRTLIAEERRSKALEYRKAGGSYQEIAVVLGTTPSNVYKMICKSLELIRECTDETAQEVRTLELQRLDRLFHIAYKAAIGGDTKAIDQALRCMERRARLLGLDAPAKLAQTDSQGKDIDGWQHLQAVVLQVLEPHPEIKSVLIDRLLQEEK